MCVKKKFSPMTLFTVGKIVLSSLALAFALTLTGCAGHDHGGKGCCGDGPKCCSDGAKCCVDGKCTMKDKTACQNDPKCKDMPCCK